MNLWGWLIWISLMECLDYVRCVHQVFGGFPTHCVWGIVKPFPFDEIKEPWPLATLINPAVQDLMDFPLI